MDGAAAIAPVADDRGVLSWEDAAPRSGAGRRVLVHVDGELTPSMQSGFVAALEDALPAGAAASSPGLHLSESSWLSLGLGHLLGDSLLGLTFEVPTESSGSLGPDLVTRCGLVFVGDGDEGPEERSVVTAGWAKPGHLCEPVFFSVFFFEFTITTFIIIKLVVALLLLLLLLLILILVLLLLLPLLTIVLLIILKLLLPPQVKQASDQFGETVAEVVAELCEEILEPLILVLFGDVRVARGGGGGGEAGPEGRGAEPSEGPDSQEEPAPDAERQDSRASIPDWEWLDAPEKARQLLAGSMKKDTKRTAAFRTAKRSGPGANLGALPDQWALPRIPRRVAVMRVRDAFQALLGGWHRKEQEKKNSPYMQLNRLGTPDEERARSKDTGVSRKSTLTRDASRKSTLTQQREPSRKSTLTQQRQGTLQPDDSSRQGTLQRDASRQSTLQRGSTRQNTLQRHVVGRLEAMAAREEGGRLEATVSFVFGIAWGLAPLVRGAAQPALEDAVVRLLLMTQSADILPLPVGYSIFDSIPDERLRSFRHVYCYYYHYCYCYCYYYYLHYLYLYCYY